MLRNHGIPANIEAAFSTEIIRMTQRPSSLFQKSCVELPENELQEVPDKARAPMIYMHDIRANVIRFNGNVTQIHFIFRLVKSAKNKSAQVKQTKHQYA
jgi:hypothetical protein